MAKSQSLAGWSCLGAIMLAVSHTAFAQQAAESATTVPTDAELHASLVTLLAALDIHELDPGLDGIEQAEAREKAIRLAIQKYSDEIRKRAADNSTIAWLPLTMLRRIGRWNRMRRGRCPMCGHDLRGKHDAACSECGWRRSESEQSNSRGST